MAATSLLQLPTLELTVAQDPTLTLDPMAAISQPAPGPPCSCIHLEKAQEYSVRWLCYTLGGTPEPQQCTLGYSARYLIIEALFQQSPGPAARPLGGVTGLFCPAWAILHGI